MSNTPTTPSTTTAVVTLRISVKVDSCWGAECTMEQIQKQAEDGARNYVENLFRTDSQRARLLSMNIDTVHTTTTKDPKR